MTQFIMILIPLPFMGFWLWMFRDMINNDYLSSAEKNDWTVKFIFLNIFAAGFYYLIEYRNRYL